ncbi:unnamed protein product [Prorocentrum cordatum]|uniref:C2 domain-containing protein n=1 Tax=Prorocentrum cordatum TaxID=2364126 RepID=A0ABN9QBP1_9DINO|nr:unnamed protein product [Polarella glacialis]
MGDGSRASHLHVPRPHWPSWAHAHMPGSHHHDYTPINTDEEAHLSPRSFRGHHRQRTHVPEELERAAAPLREGLERRLPFHQHRWKCVSQPERAGFILGAHARLEVTLVEARGLVPSQGGGFLRHPHPFVRVLLDDTTVHETPHVRASRSPVWDDHCSVDIVAGASMVRFAVNDMDSDKEENAVDMLQMNAGELDVSDRKHAGLGFVEICVEDIPFDQELDGWLELRLAGNLQGNSRDRYLQHCGQREDALHKAMEEQLRRHDVARGRTESHRRADCPRRRRRRRSHLELSLGVGARVAPAG